MNAREWILALQWEQFKHDETYHKDIFVLNVADRMKHFSLHISKYCGRLLESIEDSNHDLYQRTLTDTVIICLASANTLRMDLAKLTVTDTDLNCGTLQCLGQSIAKNNSLDSHHCEWLFRELTKTNGRLSKACESLDHIEDFEFHKVMVEAIGRMFMVVVVDSATRDWDLVELVRARHKATEPRYMFHKFALRAKEEK